ncbi:hypothetical protein QFZ60_001555 [Arthrobacter sp. B2I5]|uniref:hypothetical protein n=1 Tax=Arthrobacter sp. B2I5 TaxID=3042266 RepID=UPI00278B9BDA|nr:hypothetical protein [Arthrobacter sp. B2I5]MDQ0825382.1 hypothetical protein [Arthrobacter sp. B2I5]
MKNAIYLAKGGGGGHASGGRASSSAGRSSSSRSSSGTSRSSTTSRTKAGGSFRSSSGKTIKTSSTKPSNGKYSNQAGIVGADGYTPKFRSGYTAPEGSVVYYPQHSGLDYLPWIYLFSQHSPAYDNATVVQPDNKQMVATPSKEVDGMAVFNWILIIIFIAAAIWGVMWVVNKATTKEQPRYGW